MKKDKIERIHICGIYGCGKTTLAKDLSRIMKIPYYSLDDIKYKVKYSVVRTVRQRITTVNTICKKKRWITEGSWSGYAENAFKNADLVIFMNIPRLICAFRVLKRYIRRKKEDADTLYVTLKMIRNIQRYHTKDMPVSLIAHKKMVAKHKKPVFYIFNKKDKEMLLHLIKSMYKQ